MCYYCLARRTSNRCRPPGLDFSASRAMCWITFIPYKLPSLENSVRATLSGLGKGLTASFLSLSKSAGLASSGRDGRFGLLFLGADGLKFRGVVGCRNYQPEFLRGTVFRASPSYWVNPHLVLRLWSTEKWQFLLWGCSVHMTEDGKLGKSTREECLAWKLGEEPNPPWLDAQGEVGRTPPKKLVNILNNIIKKTLK